MHFLILKAVLGSCATQLPGSWLGSQKSTLEKKWCPTVKFFIDRHFFIMAFQERSNGACNPTNINPNAIILTWIVY